MSSVLHPVGPEPRERYWVRRLAVLVAAIVAIGVVIALVGNAMSAGSAVQAEPAPPSIAPVTLPPVTPSASPTPVDTASPTPSASPAPGADATPGTSVSPTPGDVVTPDAGQTPSRERSTAPTATDKKQAEQRAAEKKAAAKKKADAKKQKKKVAPVLASCPASGVRSTLTGPRKVKATKAATFALSLINGSGKPCYVKVTGANFRLTVVSGKDRIWSSSDCPAVVPTSSRKLAAEKSVAWKVTWNGHRSAAGCKNGREKPKPGYYWAIASFDDAKEVRWRLILT